MNASANDHNFINDSMNISFNERNFINDSMDVSVNDHNFINDRVHNNKFESESFNVPSSVNNVEWLIGNLTGTWEEITVDSGAAESVAPEDWHMEFPLLQTDRAHPAGFASATGQAMPHRGERQMHLITGNGNPSAMGD